MSTRDKRQLRADRQLFLLLPVTSSEICPPCFKNYVRSSVQTCMYITAQMLFSVSNRSDPKILVSATLQHEKKKN